VDEGGSGNGASLFQRLRGGGLRGSSFTGDLEDTLRKTLEMGISLHGAPFHPRGTWYVGGKAHILGTLIDE